MDTPRLFRIRLHPFVAMFCAVAWYYLVRADSIVRWKLPDPFRDTSLWGVVVLGIVGGVLAIIALDFLLAALTQTLLHLFWPGFSGRLSDHARDNLRAVCHDFLANGPQHRLNPETFKVALSACRMRDTRYLIALFDHGLLRTFLPELSQWISARWRVFSASMHCVGAVLVTLVACAIVTYTYLDVALFSHSRLVWFWLVPFLAFAACLFINGWFARGDALNMLELLLTGECPTARLRGVHATIWNFLRRKFGRSAAAGAAVLPPDDSVPAGAPPTPRQQASPSSPRTTSEPG